MISSEENPCEGCKVWSLSEKPFEWFRVILEVIGILASFLILGLSTIREKESFNIGPRIFAANLMVVNIVLSAITLIRDYTLVNDWFLMIVYSQFGGVVSWTHAIQSLALLVFNCSFVPMMSVTLISLYSTHILSTKKTATCFACIVIASDVIPTVFQVLNARVLIPTGAPKTYVTIPYTAVCYALYVLQIVLTAVSLTVIYKKSQHQHFSGNTKDEAKAKLRRTVLFAIGPCIVQIPFACNIVVQVMTRQYQTSFGNFPQSLSAAVSVVFALKPTVDALSLLCFMGEYRQYPAAFISYVKKRTGSMWNPKTFTTRVEPINTIRTVTAAPASPSRIHTIT